MIDAPLIDRGTTLARKLDYRKFDDEHVSVLVLDGSYLLVDDCTRALEQMGHSVARVPVHDDLATVVKQLLWVAIETKPDFVLSINHIGFDEGGTLGGLLQEINLPTAVWYVDSPGFVLSGVEPPAPSLSTVFCWERAWIPSLHQAGFDDVTYLPLATDPTRFFPSTQPSELAASFVGDSMQKARKKWRSRVSSGGQAIARKAAAAMRELPRALPMRAVEAIAPKLTGKRKSDVTALCTWSATASYRRDVLRAIPQDDLHIFGDNGWRSLLPDATVHGPIHYGRELSHLYARSAVNLNATSLQMPTAVNQRVFDVPASGGFLLTDYQSDLEELFDLDREVVTYSEPQELSELYARYRTDRHARDAIANAAKRRIGAEHTYQHRMQTLIQTLRNRHSVRAQMPRSIS